MVSRGIGRWWTLAREHPYVALFGLHLLLTLAVWPRAVGVEPIGDEAQYVDGARALSNLVRDLALGTAPDTAELQRNVVASGWFMPGTSLILTPLFLVLPDAGDTAVRLYSAVVSSMVLLWAARSVGRLLGERYAVALLILPGLVPMWLLFSYASWGDLYAGLVAAVLIAEVVVLGRRLLDGDPIRWEQGARIGILMAIALYFRSSAQPLVGGLLVLMVVGSALLLPRRLRGRSLVSVGLAGVVLATLVAPWSVAASRTLDSRVVLTTTLPVSLANTFGDRDRLCYGPCDRGSSIWFSPLRFSREVARATGRSEVEVQGEMASYALNGAVTPTSYADDVSLDLNRYLLRAPGYEQQFRGVDSDLDAGALAIDAGTALLYYPALVIALGFMLAVARRGAGLDRRLRSVLFKLCGFAFLVQPFVHVGSSRYWPIFAPLIAFMAVWWWEGRADPLDGTPEGRLGTALRRVEIALAIGFGTVTALVLTLGAL